jgi:hypothetical protein
LLDWFWLFVGLALTSIIADIDFHADTPFVNLFNQLVSNPFWVWDLLALFLQVAVDMGFDWFIVLDLLRSGNFKYVLQQLVDDLIAIEAIGCQPLAD